MLNKNTYNIKSESSTRLKTDQGEYAESENKCITVTSNTIQG